MAEVSASGVAHVGKESFGEGLTVLAKYILPLGGVLAGFAFAKPLGGAQSIANAIWNGGGGNNAVISGTSANRLGGVIIASVWGLVGTAFWSMRSRGGIWMAAIGGLLGGLFFGAALGNIPTAITGNAPASGMIENLTGGITKIAEGN